MLVCKIPLLARSLGLKAAARPSVRATIGYKQTARGAITAMELSYNYDWLRVELGLDIRVTLIWIPRRDGAKQYDIDSVRTQSP